MPCAQARGAAVGIEQLPANLERHGGNFRLLPGVPNSPNPGLMVRQGPIGIRLIAERCARVKMSSFRLLLRSSRLTPILRPSWLLADGVHSLERVQEQSLLCVP